MTTAAAGARTVTNAPPAAHVKSNAHRTVKSVEMTNVHMNTTATAMAHVPTNTMPNAVTQLQYVLVESIAPQAAHQVSQSGHHQMTTTQRNVLRLARMCVLMVAADH
jgi:hypothetical protein